MAITGTCGDDDGEGRGGRGLDDLGARARAFLLVIGGELLLTHAAQDQVVGGAGPEGVPRGQLPGMSARRVGSGSGSSESSARCRLCWPEQLVCGGVEGPD